MLTLSPNLRIFVALGVTDMRKSFDTLAEVVRGVMGEDPLSGQVFVFSNRARNRIKILWWDRGGFWLLARRLERGTFAWPRERARAGLQMRVDDLLLLLNGLDPSRFQHRAWYERAS